MEEKHAIVGTMVLFVLIWAALYGLYRGLPYVTNGSDLVFRAKLRWEEQGEIFPPDPKITRVLIFGNSKVLSGFVPALFDQLSSAKQLRVSSFNSGFPASDLFLPPLHTMCKRGQAPNVLLLTLPWNPNPPRRDFFHLIRGDHELIDRLFPFRNFVRDATAFLLSAPSHGGLVQYYREAEAEERAAIADRGYHLITEQSHFSSGRLPDDFHLASDRPAQVVERAAPMHSAQIGQLNQLLRQYRISCYYVPYYLRQGEAAAAPYDRRFSALLDQTTACKLIGPDYFLFPNRYFTDQTHLNETGARAYTEALFQLLTGSAHALQ